MLDHMGISVSDYDTAKDFYATALAPLGYELAMEYGDWAGFGVAGEADFWLIASGAQTPPIHIAFGADNRAIVDAFYEAALAAGGRDNGPPGLREIYHPHYYGAFILDADGNNIEAVCHKPE